MILMVLNAVGHWSTAEVDPTTFQIRHLDSYREPDFGGRNYDEKIKELKAVLDELPQFQQPFRIVSVPCFQQNGKERKLPETGNSCGLHAIRNSEMVLKGLLPSKATFLKEFDEEHSRLELLEKLETRKSY